MIENIFKKDKYYRVYIIAEIGINHNGSLQKAFYLIDQAKKSGADAVKFQTFKTELLIKRNAPKMPYQRDYLRKKENQFTMLKRVELGRKEHKAIIDYCNKRKIDFISTPYDTKSADMLLELGVRVLKISSTDTTNLPFLRYLKSLEVPLIISTGVTDMPELIEAMDVFVPDKTCKIALLHCVSNYPAQPEELNLRCIKTLEEAFSYPVGFSDHTNDLFAGAYAVCAGARILEKHFTFDKNALGPDHKASVLPEELKLYIDKVRQVEKYLGDGQKRIMHSEQIIKKHMQKSIVAGKNLVCGKIIKEADLWTMRPATGISPLCIDRVIGKRLKKSKVKFEQISWKDLKDA